MPPFSATKTWGRRLIGNDCNPRSRVFPNFFTITNVVSINRTIDFLGGGKTRLHLQAFDLPPHRIDTDRIGWIIYRKR